MQRTRTFLAAVSLFVVGLVGCVIVPVGVRGSGEIVSEAREVGSFEAVELASVGELRITQGESTALTVEADDNILPLIRTEVRGGTLVIDTVPNRSINPSQTPRYLLTVATLEGIGVSGSGNVRAEPLNSNALTINVSGSGEVRLAALTAESLNVEISGSGSLTIDELAVEQSTIDLSGSGEVELAGETVSQALAISGSGAVRAADLSSQTATVEIAGGGEATLRVAETLDVEISGSGEARYYGEPRVQSEVSGSGSVERAGE